MAPALIPLRYYLPKTMASIGHVKSKIIENRNSEHYVADEFVTTLNLGRVADRTVQYTTSFDEDFLETLSVTVQLDDEGVIESISGESGRDITPFLEIASSVIQLASASILLAQPNRPSQAPTQSLEKQWETRNENLVQYRAGLEGQLLRLADFLVDPTSTPTDIVELNAAVSAIQFRLYELDRIQREWIASRARSSAPENFHLDTKDIIRVNSRSLPPALMVEPTDIPRAQEITTQEHGFLIVVADPNRSAVEQTVDSDLIDSTDTICFRRTRTAKYGIYRRENGLETNRWLLEPNCSEIVDIVDEFSPMEVIRLDASWLRKRKVTIEFHDDGSIKTYGIVSNPALSSAAIGTSLDSVGKFIAKARSAPTPEERELERAKFAFDQLKTADEMSKLTALTGRAAELAELEQRARIAELGRKS